MNGFVTFVITVRDFSRPGNHPRPITERHFGDAIPVPAEKIDVPDNEVDHNLGLTVTFLKNK